jgi:DNA-binding NarL/FixJ family response regulator
MLAGPQMVELQRLRKSIYPRDALPHQISRRVFDHLYCNDHDAMPRRPLEEINTNSRRGTELSPYVQSKVATLRTEGITISEIADRAKISENTVK